MASSTPKTILLQVNGAERPVYDDRPAAAATTPGELVEITSAGKITPVASAGKVVGKLFAVEAPWADDPTNPAIDQDYAANDTVRYVYAQPGDLVYAWLAASNEAAIGSILVSTATAGQLGVATVDATTLAGAVVGIAEEAVTTTAAAARIKVRVV